MSKLTHIAAIAGLAAVLASPALAAKSDYQRDRNASEAGQVWQQQNPDRNFYYGVPGSRHDFQLEGR